ncbi:MAG TPA: N-acetyltransferase [Candidatus Acidoferrales bacterium]|nr:N-acetyltransferase [Candidatus Acidoferrales bacterium]
MTTTVRLARSDDLAFIDALGLQTALDTVSPIRALSRKAAENAYQRLVAFCRERAGTVTFVGERDGQRAGFLMLVTDLPDDVSQKPQAFIAYIAVATEHRNHGVGRALVRAARAEGLRRKLPHLSLMVSADNALARGLYESEGFMPERILMTSKLAEDETP